MIPMDTLEFQRACDAVIHREKVSAGIGTLGEKTLHAVLKHYFEPYTPNHEIKVGGFVADIVGESGIIEIQTRGFDKLRRKLEAFLEVAPVTVVYPVAQTKWLCWIDEGGSVSNRRKSPKTGKVFEVFDELYKIKPYLSHPNLRLCIVLLELEEYRFLNGWGRDKKRGSTRCDRIPVRLCDEIRVEGPWDYAKLIPEGLDEAFTAKEYKAAAGIYLSTAQTGLNILNSLGTVIRAGKKGNAYIYIRA